MSEKAKVEENKIEGFDYRAVIRDPKTGEVIKTQPWSLTVSQDHGEVLRRDGKCFAPNGVEIQDPYLKKPEDPKPEVQAEVKPERKPEVLFTKKA